MLDRAAELARRPSDQPDQPPQAMGPVVRVCLRRAQCPVVVVAPDNPQAGHGSQPRPGPWPRPTGDVRPYLAKRSYRLDRDVPDLRDFLSRFRPAGAPGAARAGVPADRRSELAAEVGPVLALLTGTQAECERIVAQAGRDAAQLTAEATTEAAAIAADAEPRAAGGREEAAGRVMTAARDEAATAVRDAERQAAGISELAGRRMPALVGRAVETIRRLETDDR